MCSCECTNFHSPPVLWHDDAKDAFRQNSFENCERFRRKLVTRFQADKISGGIFVYILFSVCFEYSRGEIRKQVFFDAFGI